MQDDLFFYGEGDAWFLRNVDAINNEERWDWPIHIIKLLNNTESFSSVLELGCSNGWRLNRVQKLLGDAYYVGIDASKAAIDDGMRHYHNLNLFQGTLANIPVKEEFDLVIVNFVFHWIDRKTFIRSLAEVDRMVKDGGILLLGDFSPDYPQRRRYHHLPRENVFTYKQDYVQIFESFGTYKQIVKFTYDHDDSNNMIQLSKSNQRAFCAALKKSLVEYYHEVEV